MKVCAEYEDQITAFTAHRKVLENGGEPEDIEIRSPYPLSEHPIPPHKSKPMIMRNIARVGWLCGLIGGFSFISFTQLEWGLTAKTGGHPLVALPINSIIMYECGMITAILLTTLMFFVETRRYRQLVPALEEDMPVANGYIALVVSGETAKKAKDWLKDTNARSVVSYMLPLALMSSLFLTGCATGNMRYQQVIKPGEAAADIPPGRSIAMPSRAQAEVTPPEPYGWLYYGDQIAYDRAKAELKTKIDDLDAQVKAKTKKRKDANKEGRAIKKEYKALFEEIEPELFALKKNSVPEELKALVSPVEADEESLARGQKLYETNCLMCHGEKGMGDGKVGEVWGGPGAVANIGDGGKYGDKEKFADGYFYHFIMTGKNKMPSFGYKLTTRETWDIVNHVRKLQGS